MQTITEIIAPIKLLSGSHPDTAKTGHGCFMNVIAYLNGEPQITDQSPCVCFVVRPIAIWLNDYLTQTERARLIPYIERAMGSNSDDPAIFVPRAEAAARFAIKCSEIAASAASAVWAARKPLIEAAFMFLDEALPPATGVPAATVERAEKLISIIA